MAAPTDNLPSFGDLTSTKQNAFINQKEHYAKKSINRPVMFQDEFSTVSRGHLKEMHLQQQWQELKERERIAQQHNRQLLRQFEDAQDTLKEMLARNAAMKTIRETPALKLPLWHLQMEYERYLEKNVPRWQQQLQEKTQMAEKKKMEDYLRSYLKKTEQEQMPMSTADGPLLSQSTSIRPQKNIPQAYSTQEYPNYNQDRSAQYPYLQSSWLTHTQSQTGRIPVRVPAQTQNPTILSPPNFPHPHPFIHHLTSMGVHHYPQSRQDAAYWDPSDYNYPWPRAAGIPPGSWGQLYTEEPHFELRDSETGKQEDEISGATSSKGERGGGRSSSHLSPELDIKPVRLPSAHAESSESSRDSSVTSSREKRKKREKRERTQYSSSESERRVSQELSRTSSEIVIASVAVAQSSVTETSTEKEHTRSSRTSKRGGGLIAGSPRSEKAVKEQTRNHNKESQPAGEESGSSSEESMKEKAGHQMHNENTESCREEQESGRDSVKNENIFKVEIEKQENSSSGQSSAEENDEERRKPRAGENEKKEESRKNESDEANDDNEVSAKINTTEEEVGTAEEDEDDQGDDEESNKLKNNDAEIRKQGSVSSRDEDGSEDNKEDEEAGSNEEENGESEEEEEENRSEKGEEENRDSEDSIISPQEKRSKQMQIIPEDGVEEDDDEECKEGSSHDESNEVSDEDDVENLLAPHGSKTEEQNGKADGKPKAISHNMDIFQVVDARSKTDPLSDSDEFDHFYD